MTVLGRTGPWSDPAGHFWCYYQAWGLPHFLSKIWIFYWEVSHHKTRWHTDLLMHRAGCEHWRQAWTWMCSAQVGPKPVLHAVRKWMSYSAFSARNSDLSGSDHRITCPTFTPVYLILTSSYSYNLGLLHWVWKLFAFFYFLARDLINVFLPKVSTYSNNDSYLPCDLLMHVYATSTY